jgi:trimeric autotransporter adhesin
MSASISSSGFIKSSGVTVENEPIILSDGVGAVTQWDNSTQGAGEGIYFVEGGSAGDPLRLGIGVAAPTGALDVAGGITQTASTPALIVKDTQDKSWAKNDALGSLQFHTADTSGVGAHEIAGIHTETDEAGTNTQVAGAMLFKTAPYNNATPVERLRISSDGMVTVTNATEAKLQLRNTKDWGSGDSGNIGTLEFYSTDPSGAGARVVGAVQCAQNAASAAPNGELVFKTAAGGGSAAAAVERMRISSTGGVQVGTPAGATNDVSGLHVAVANSTDQLYLERTTGSTGRWWLGTASNTFYVHDDVAGADRLTISSTGVVSIAGSITVGSLDIGHGLGAETTNTAVGQNALDATVAGCIHNTAIGNSALTALNNGTGDYNTVVGSLSADALETGARNSTLGYGTLSQSTAGNDNVAVGYLSLLNYTGSNAVAVGSQAADAATDAANLTAVGTDALSACTEGDHNTAVGMSALATVTTGEENVAIGKGAGYSVTGDRNVIVGKDAAYYATSVTDTIAIGAIAFRGDGATAPTGDYNIAIGNYTLDAATSGEQNTAIGYSALSSLTNGSYNTAVGLQAGQDVTGDNNVLVGRYAGFDATSISDCVAIGRDALRGDGSTPVTGDYNVAIGSYALEAITTGYANIAIGHAAGRDIVAGYHNLAIGFNTGVELENGDQNLAIGSYALASEDDANGCVAIGYSALTGQNGSVNNTGIGFNTLRHNKSGTGSTALGYQAGYANVDGYNTWIGHDSGRYTGHAAANTTLGYNAYKSSSFSNGTCDLNGSTTVTCDSNTDIQVGQSVTGSGIPYGAYVTAVNDSTGVTSFTLSEAATTTASNTTLTFYRGTGDSNTCIGYTAGEDITWGYENVLTGRDAGKNFTTNSQNVAIGAYALDAANGGENFNVAVGYATLSTETSGADYCTAVGYSALLNQNANVKNTAIGGLAGDAITSGDENTLVGYSAGSGIVSGAGNTVAGHSAFDSGTGSYNTVLGTYAARAGTGNENVVIGYAAGNALTDGPGNVLIGKSAGAAMTTGDYNIAIGFQAADAMVGESNWNTAIGAGALGSEASGADHCIAIGYQALLSQNHADAINLAIGVQAGDAITSGTSNVIIGHQAGSAVTTSNSNTVLGRGAFASGTGATNVVIGSFAMDGASSGSANVAVGTSAMGATDAACDNNVAVGNAALFALSHNDADNNVAVGYNAGRYYETTASTTPGSGTPDGDNTAGANSIFIGYDTRSAESDRTNEIVIGHTAVSNGSNTITLGNDDTAAIHCNDTSIAALSDRRIKRDIKNTNVGLSFVDKLTAVEYKRLNPADWPEEIRSHRYRVEEQQELVTPAVEAAEAVYEDVVVVEAREAVEEVTETIEHPAQEEVWEDVIIPAVEELSEERVTQTAQEEITEERVVQEAREEVKGERQKYTETEVTETVTREEIVEIDGKWVRREVSEEVTRTERTPVYEECDVYNEDGTQCMCCVTEARDAVTEERQVVDENGDGVVGEDGNPVMETVEIEPAVEAVYEPMKHKVPVMEEYVVQAAQEEVRETVVVQEAQDEVREMVVVREAEPERTERRLVSPAVPARTEVRVITPAEPAVEEVVERRLVKEAVEAQEAVYKTVTVPADERPDDDDTVRLGLIAQDVQTAMSDAGVEFDLVTTGANGKLAVKYSNLVIPLLKAVQELSAEVKALKG